jgi:hypothetical protein
VNNARLPSPVSGSWNAWNCSWSVSLELCIRVSNWRAMISAKPASRVSACTPSTCTPAATCAALITAAAPKGTYGSITCQRRTTPLACSDIGRRAEVQPASANAAKATTQPASDSAPDT